MLALVYNSVELAVVYSDSGATGFIFGLRLVATKDVKDVYYLVW